MFDIKKGIVFLLHLKGNFELKNFPFFLNV